MGTLSGETLEEEENEGVILAGGPDARVCLDGRVATVGEDSACGGGGGRAAAMNSAATSTRWMACAAPEGAEEAAAEKLSGAAPPN